ncbi:hypothetical protein LTR65_000707 [Meristemomyces frigidus]
MSVRSSASTPSPARGRESGWEAQLLSPDVARLPPPRTPASTRSRFRDNSSEYYTAAWGSPYERSSSPARSARTALSEQVPSEDQLESSPLQSFGLEHLVPSRIGVLSLPRPSLAVLGRAVTDQDDSHTRRSRTKRWVQLPQRQHSERSHWWSDESRSISDEERKHRRAPSSVSGRAVARGSSTGHRPREANRTLNQQSFLETLRDGQPGEMSGLYASRWADTPPPDEQELGKQVGMTDSIEKPLPELPAEIREDTETMAVASNWTGKDMVMEANVEKKDEPEAHPSVPTGSEAKGNAGPTPPLLDAECLEPPRIRKRVSWRGKNCVISIPNVNFEAVGLPMPLSTSEVQQRLMSFEEAGYSTYGFNLSHEEGGVNGDPSHVRPIYPDETESRAQASQQRPRVSLPDLSEWRAYETWLIDQKLAALGVSTGLDEPPLPPSCQPQDMSRQSSGQYPQLPFSPPIPTGSAGSMGGRPGMMRGHSHTMSVASPLSPGIGPFGHMHRHSTFTGPHGFPQLQTQPLPQPQLPPFPGMSAFSPGKQPAMPGFPPRGGSPAQIAALQQDFGHAHGPGSPLSQQMFAQSPQDYSRGLMDDQRRRQHAYSQSVQYQPQHQPQHQPMPNTFLPQAHSVQRTPILPELPEEEDERELRETTPDGAAYVPPHKRAQFNGDVAVPTPTRGHRHNPSEGLEREVLEAEQRHEAEKHEWIEGSQAETRRQSGTNGVHEPTARQYTGPSHADQFAMQQAVQQAAPSHKKTASRFNVAAPAFTFNPAASFKPTSNAFTFGATPPKTNGAVPNGHTRQVSSGSFNVAAPAFKPANAPSVPKSEFSFFAQGPAFKPGVPAVEPHQPVPSGRTVVDDLPSIFGKVNIPDIVKPVKKSKAVAIVRPDESARKSHDSGEEFEDDEGRIAQSDDRLKRQRHGGDDGDEVPQFAEPTPMPDPADFAPMAPGLQPVVDGASVEQVEAEVGAALDKVAEKGAESVEAAIETAHPQHHEPAVFVKPTHGHKASSSLSAFAKPFEPYAMRRADDEASEGRSSTGHEHVTSISELEDGEIREDEQSAVSPVHSRQSSAGLALAMPVTQNPIEYSASERIGVVAFPEPSFDEIDAVMRQLNGAEDDSEREQTLDRAMSPLPSLDDLMPGATHLPEWGRSDGRSPSPTRSQAVQHAPADSSFTVHERTDSGEAVVNGWANVHRLNKAEDVPGSDWSGMLSPPEEEKLQARSNFFDMHIEELLGRVVERRLQPLEESLRNVQSTVSKPSRSMGQPSHKRTSSKVDSDADDEDDLSDAPRQRPVSRGRDKRVDEIKAAVWEALREQSPRRSQSSHDIADLHSALADMKVSFARAASASMELDDVRAVVEELLNRQSQAVAPLAIEERRDNHGRQVSELEGRLSETLAGALEEANHRRAIEEREGETRRLLRLAEEELHLLRDSSRDDDGRLSAMEGDRRELLERAERAEEAQQSAEDQVKSLVAETDAMQGTLEEYRLSSTKWRVDIDEGKHEREELERTVASLERQVEEGQDSGTGMRRRLEKLHADMATAAGQLAGEKAAWRAREDDYRSRCGALEAQQAAQARHRQELEDELRVARLSVAEASDARLALDSSRTSNASLHDLVRKLQSDLAEQQSLAARIERDFQDARDTGRAEIHRARMSLETDVEAANHQVNTVRAELENELLKVRMELESVKIEAETAKARHDRLLEEEDSARKEALRKVSHANSVALDDLRQKHEAALQELLFRHGRAVEYAVEDKERSDYILNERLALSQAKLDHSHDRILHLEERLEVARSAAQAAAMSAQTKIPSAASIAGGIPEKVSPQALRESILVLQEQLQERESRMDRLQNEVDKEGPAKLKERDTEITWLRELLGVRNEDLTDLVNTLAKPTFDRDNVRDIAIRIRANLQMEQQEKERFGPGSQFLGGQALASLSSFATPKAASLTSAFNKWRSTMESSSLRHAPRYAPPVRSITPSKARPSALPDRYNAGLMTPPASNFRNTPSPEATMSVPPPRLQAREDPRPSTSALSNEPSSHSRQVSSSSDAPTTPLLREQSYDLDAEDNEIHMQSFEDDDLDVADSEPPAFRSLESELEPLPADAVAE